MMDSQSIALAGSVLVMIATLAFLARPSASGKTEKTLRAELKALTQESQAAKAKLDHLNHSLTYTQALVEEFRPYYARGRRVKQAIGEMKQVWLSEQSSEAECARILRDNLWILSPEYPDIQLLNPPAADGGANLYGVTSQAAGPLDDTAAGGAGQAYLLIDVKAKVDAALTRAALAQATQFAEAEDLRGKRIECLLIGRTVADGVGGVQLRSGHEAQSSIRITPVTYRELIARAEFIDNLPTLAPVTKVASRSDTPARRAAA